MTWFGLGASAATVAAILLLSQPRAPTVTPPPVSLQAAADLSPATPEGDLQWPPDVEDAPPRPRPAHRPRLRYVPEAVAATTDTRFGIRVHWRNRSPGPYLYGFTTTLNRHAQDLAQRARAGDGQAAFALYRVLASCGGIRVERALSGEDLFAMSTPYTYPARTDYETALPTGRWGQACTQIDELGAAQDWLRVAGRLGDVNALLQIALTEFPSAASVAALEQMWLAGDPRATILLARASRDGWSDGDVFIEPDPAVALAYDMIAADLLPHVDASGRNPVFASSLNARIDTQVRGLGAASIDAAVDMAQTMLRSNENCCVRTMAPDHR